MFILLLYFRGRSRRAYDVSDSTAAQKKFGSAKAISSDQFFGNKDPDVSVEYFDGLFSISIMLFL